MYSAPFSSIYSYSPTALLAEEAAFSELSFGDYDLQNGLVNVTKHDLESPGTIQYIAKDRGLANGATFIDKKTRLRPMTVVGYLIGDDRQTVEELADAFKQKIDQTQAYLRFKTRGETWRQILATATNVSMPREAYHVTKIPFTITFTANDPFWQAVEWLSDNFLDVTAATLIDGINNPGSAEMDVKIYMVMGTGNVGVSTVAFTANNRTLTVSQALADGDVLLLDLARANVYYNAVKHDYGGTAPFFLPGNNDFSIAVNGTHNYSLLVLKTIKYK